MNKYQGHIHAKHKKNDALITALQNRNMFDAISHRYDVLNKILSFGLDRYWRKKTISLLDITREGIYLDVGCGTGDLSLLLRIINQHISIYGCDPSEHMISLAQKKTEKINIKKPIWFHRGDALHLPYKDNVFSGVLMGFCIRNVTDRTRALHELYRVLKPEGSMAIVELTIPESGIIKFPYAVYTKLILPHIAGLLTQKSAYTYLNKSIEAFPSNRIFLKLVKNAGFKRCQATILFPGTVTVFSGMK